MRKPTTREIRLLILLAIFVALAAWFYLPRPWSPRVTIETEHYVIRSSATEEQTREVESVERQWYGYLAELQRLTRRATPPVRVVREERFLSTTTFRPRLYVIAPVPSPSVLAAHR